MASLKKIIRLMLLVYEDMPLSEVVEENVELIPVLDRFGITLGLSDKTAGEICAEKGVETGFFLAVVNNFLNPDYFPEKQLKTSGIGVITDYLLRTEKYYMEYQLPNIEAHLGRLINGCPSSQALGALRILLSSFRESLSRAVRYDTDVWLPYCASLPADGKGNAADAPRYDDCAYVEGMNILHEMKGVMVRHLSGDYDRNLCYAVIFSISSMEKDISMHHRIHGRILRPLVASLTEKRG